MIALEDRHTDILKKASIGKSLSRKELAKRTQLDLKTINQIFEGTHVDDHHIDTVCQALELNFKALKNHIDQTHTPKPISVKGLKLFQSTFPHSEEAIMYVNNFIVYDEAQALALAFDTGTDFQSVKNWLKQTKLSLKSVLITHKHRDHIHCLEDYLKTDKTLPLHASFKAQIRCKNPKPIRHGQTIQYGPFTITILETPGHTEDGISYHIKGLEKDIVIVGDALFAHSQGGILNPESYAQAIKTNQKELLSLQEDTVIAPGHGPLTSVAHERQYNPFYADYFA